MRFALTQQMYPHTHIPSVTVWIFVILHIYQAICYHFSIRFSSLFIHSLAFFRLNSYFIELFRFFRSFTWNRFNVLQFFFNIHLYFASTFALMYLSLSICVCVFFHRNLVFRCKRTTHIHRRSACTHTQNVLPLLKCDS